MGSRPSLLLRDEELAGIQKETGFSANQIERLYSRFTSLDKSNNGALTREDFLRIPELAINPLGERLVHQFFRGIEEDRGNRQFGDSEDGGETRRTVNFLQFVRVLAHFRPLKKNRDNNFNSREGKLHFAFKLYDLDDDDRITKEELLSVLQMMVGENIREEQLSSIAERTITEADTDGDGMISYEEFTKALERCDIEQKMSIRFLN